MLPAPTLARAALEANRLLPNLGFVDCLPDVPFGFPSGLLGKQWAGRWCVKHRPRSFALSASSRSSSGVPWGFSGGNHRSRQRDWRRSFPSDVCREPCESAAHLPEEEVGAAPGFPPEPAILAALAASAIRRFPSGALAGPFRHRFGRYAPLDHETCISVFQPIAPCDVVPVLRSKLLRLWHFCLGIQSRFNRSDRCRLRPISESGKTNRRDLSTGSALPVDNSARPRHWAGFGAL